jgi:DNA polymerase III delta prime subunit
MDEEEVDARPEHKVLLLTGPPGLGKTTLAQVILKILPTRRVHFTLGILQTDRRMGSHDPTNPPEPVDPLILLTLLTLLTLLALLILLTQMLMQVLANHAGYNFIEINASDDRSEKVLLSLLLFPSLLHSPPIYVILFTLLSLLDFYILH